MRQLFLICISMLFIISCKKNIITKAGMTEKFMTNVQIALKERISISDYQNLDFSRAFLSREKRQKLYFVRIPWKGKKLSEYFLLLKTDENGTIEKGKIVNLDMERDVPNFMYNGMVTISSIDRKEKIRSLIQNGYIVAWHNKKMSRSYLEPSDPYLPEVIVVGYLDNNNEIDYSTYLSLNSILGNNSSGTYSGITGSGYYASMDAGGSGYGGSYSTEGGGSGTNNANNNTNDLWNPADPSEELIEFEPEYIYSLPSVAIKKVFNCFDNVPSQGATYTLKICADVSSNSNPESSSGFPGISAGHTFLTVTKRNGATQMTQSFGFYPKSLSAASPFESVTSDIKDNGANEYNASLEMAISEAQFQKIKDLSIALSAKSYNLSDFNCTNYAVDIFNSVRGNPLLIDPYIVYLPANTNLWGISSEPNKVEIAKAPQMVFRKLNELKKSGTVEAAQITIDQTHNSRAPISKGECE